MSVVCSVPRKGAGPGRLSSWQWAGSSSSSLFFVFFFSALYSSLSCSRVSLIVVDDDDDGIIDVGSRHYLSQNRQKWKQYENIHKLTSKLSWVILFSASKLNLEPKLFINQITLLYLTACTQWQALIGIPPSMPELPWILVGKRFASASFDHHSLHLRLERIFHIWKRKGEKKPDLISFSQWNHCCCPHRGRLEKGWALGAEQFPKGSCPALRYMLPLPIRGHQVCCKQS